MSHTLSFCSGHLSGPPVRQPRRKLGPAVSTALFGATLAVLVSLTATMQAGRGVPGAAMARPAAVLMAGDGASTLVLDEVAEDVRKHLLAVPGVGAVSLEGVQSTGLDVNYAPAQMARLGVRPADLIAALPAGARLSAPGRVAVGPDAARGPQAIADLPIRAGSRVFRLGDIATVVRIRLADPVATLRQEGRPAVRIMVTPASGQAGATLDGRIAAGLAGVALPGSVLIR